MGTPNASGRDWLKGLIHEGKVGTGVFIGIGFVVMIHPLPSSNLRRSLSNHRAFHLI